MLIIPRWMGGFRCPFHFHFGHSSLLVCGTEFRNRNLRMMQEIYRSAGFEDFSDYAQSIVADRDPGLFPKSEKRSISFCLRIPVDWMSTQIAAGPSGCRGYGHG